MLAVGALAALCACASIPKNALQLSPDTLERRQLQTRRIDNVQETDLLNAAAGVLQDLGFNLDESETRLGVIVASKDRSAVTGTQIAGAVLAAMFGVQSSIDKTQKIRVSLVTRPARGSDGTPLPGSYLLRITLQRIVWDMTGKVTRTESIDEPEIYQDFFEKLSKSIFLEVHEI